MSRDDVRRNYMLVTLRGECVNYFIFTSVWLMISLHLHYVHGLSLAVCLPCFSSLLSTSSLDVIQQELYLMPVPFQNRSSLLLSTKVVQASLTSPIAKEVLFSDVLSFHFLSYNWWWPQNWQTYFPVRLDRKGINGVSL